MTTPAGSPSPHGQPGQHATPWSRHMSTGQRAMASALVLAADGRRSNGRWKRGTARDIGRSSDIESGWEKALKQCGLILDYTPDLAAAVVAGDITLNAASERGSKCVASPPLTRANTPLNGYGIPFTKESR